MGVAFDGGEDAGEFIGKKALSTKHQALNEEKEGDGGLVAALLLGVAFDGGEDSGEFIGLAVKGSESGFGVIVRGGGAQETEPDFAFIGLLFRDPDAVKKIGLGNGVVGLAIIGRDRPG